MPQSQSGITYQIRNVEGNSHYREHWAQGVNQATSILQCAWADYDQFGTDLLGFGQWVGPNLQRTLPMFHPVWDWMICTEYELIDVIGIPVSDGGIGQYQPDGDDPTTDPGAIAVVAAVFRSVLYATLTDEQAVAAGGELSRYVTRQSRYGLELLELKGAIMEWADVAGAVPAGRSGTIGASPTRPYPNTPLIYTWSRVPAIIGVPGASRPDGFPLKLWNNITATVGKINSDVFDGFYPVGTLLCGVPEIEQQVGPLGSVEFQVKYNFTYHSPQDNVSPLGGPVQTDSWNVKYRLWDSHNAISPGMYPVQIQNSDEDTPFRYAPFAALFKNA